MFVLLLLLVLMQQVFAMSRECLPRWHPVPLDDTGAVSNWVGLALDDTVTIHHHDHDHHDDARDSLRWLGRRL